MRLFGDLHKFMVFDSSGEKKSSGMEEIFLCESMKTWEMTFKNHPKINLTENLINITIFLCVRQINGKACY